jgi:hypothetical protein
MGMNGLKVNYKLGREVAAMMSVVGFVVPGLNPKTKGKRHEEDVEEDNMWWRQFFWNGHCVKILEYRRHDILLVIFG